MKKYIVLTVLFALPICAYLFFSSGVNNFVKLPTLTPNVPEVSQWTSLDGTPIQLKEKITVLGFPGSEIIKEKGNAFNLDQKIYDKNKEFKDFQVVMVAPIGTENQAKQLMTELGTISDLSHWHFVFAKPEEIKAFYSKLKLVGQLNDNLATSNVYIIDKDLNLRGRKGKNKKGEVEYKEGYNTISAADLHNEMADDVKIILAEYRLELKRNNKRKI
ncbi:hypothetical protein FEDK69T_13540 [Flavobacterium enshiense DK69]|uniref:Uncharacterized protein n=1 Tax=Flavobacterium enshiense DK69 TaxID=1107311 RepID=V6SAF6_9FLAO|nr:hypothetical protein [Flavobacterium enshiense]ESU23202.1 hypothetical protein FEDK69T_13540 [Flavobacterium enshiense DK69]KGO96563.1 hypothetical protein Q767_06635 [Flavobacterium enshiense DK69]